MVGLEILQVLVFIPLYGGFIAGAIMGVLTILSLPVLIAALIGTKFYVMGKFKMNWRVFVFIFYILGSVFTSVTMFLFLAALGAGFGAAGSTMVLLIAAPFFVSIVSLIFITIFEMKDVLNSPYWALLLAHFCACLVLAIVLIPVVFLGSFFSGIFGSPLSAMI